MHVKCVFTLAVAAVHAKHSAQNVQIAATGGVLKPSLDRAPILSGEIPFQLEDPKELPKGLPAGADTPFELDDKALAAVQQGDESSPFVLEGRHYTPASAAAMRANDSPFVVEGAPKDGPPDDRGKTKFVADGTAKSAASDSADKPFALDHGRETPDSEAWQHKRHHFERNADPGPHVAQSHTTQLIAQSTTEEPLTTEAPSTSPALSFELGAAILEKKAGAKYVEIPGTPFEMESGLVSKHQEVHQFRPRPRRSIELVRGPHDWHRIPKGSALLQTLETPVAQAADAPAAVPPVMVLPSMAPVSSTITPPVSTVAFNPAAVAPLLTALPASPLTVTPPAEHVQAAAPAQAQTAAPPAPALTVPPMSSAPAQPIPAATDQALAALPAGNLTAGPAAEQVLTAASTSSAADKPLTDSAAAVVPPSSQTAAPAANQILTAAPASPAAATPTDAAAPPKSTVMAPPPAAAPAGTPTAGVQEFAAMHALPPVAAVSGPAGPLSAGSLDAPAVIAPPATGAAAPATAAVAPTGQVAQASEAAQADQAAQAAGAAMSSGKKMMRSEVPPTPGFDGENAASGGHPSRAKGTSRLPEGQLSPAELPARELFHPQAAETDVPPIGPITLPLATAVPEAASQQAPKLDQPVHMQEVQPVGIEAKALSATGSATPAEAPPAASSADATATPRLDQTIQALQGAPASTASAPVTNAAPAEATGAAHQTPTSSASDGPGSSGTAAAEPSTSEKSDEKPALLPAPPVGVAGGNVSAGAAMDANKTVPMLTSTDSNSNTTNSSLGREPQKAVTTRGAIISMLLGLFVTLFFLAAVMVMLHLGRKPDSIDVPEKEPPRPTRSYRHILKAQKAEAAQAPTSSQPSV